MCHTSALDVPTVYELTGGLALEVSSHVFSMGAALDVVAVLSSQLNPSPQSRVQVGASGGVPIQEGDMVHVISDRGSIVGTATVVQIGEGTRFHNRELSGFAVVCWLSITDTTAAGAQLAWISDGDEVKAGITALSAVPRGQMLAVPQRCIRFLGGQ